MTEAISMKDVFDKISRVEQKMVSRNDLREYLETFEILSNPETMESIRKSRNDIKKGKFKKIDSVADMLSELKK